MRPAGTYQVYLQHETLRVIRPYFVLGLIAFTWAVLIVLTKFPSRPWRIALRQEAHGRNSDLLRYPHFILAVIAQFFYVGAQVGTWSYFIQYVQEYTHRPEKIAGYFLTGTLVAFAVGRFVSAYLMKFVCA